MTWLLQPLAVGPVVSAAAGEEYRSWPVRPMVQAMYDLGLYTGFVIRDSVENEDAEHGFSTRDSDTPPLLELRFVPFVEQPPPPPPTTTTTTTTTTTEMPPTTTTTTTTTEPPGTGMMPPMAGAASLPGSTSCR